MICNSILDTIGNTPVVRIKSFQDYSPAEIYLKLEGFNPTSSIKDRPALAMITEAEQTNRLKPGGTIIESTSGNTGKSLAMIGAARGYSVVIVADLKVPKPTLAFYRALGARIELVTEPDENGSLQGARIKRVKELLSEIPDSYNPDQYDNPNNPKIHAETTAKELLSDFNRIDVLVACVSTGGHMTGIAKTLKQHMPSVKTVAVDAVGSAIFSSSFKPYLMNGIGLSWRPGNVHLKDVDRFQLVSDVDAFSVCHLLAKREGILLGGSGGATLFACLHAAKNAPQEAKIVGVVADTGVNYLEQFYDEQWLLKKNLHLLPDVQALYERLDSTMTQEPPRRELTANSR